MILEVSFTNGSPFVISAIFIWTLVVAQAAYTLVNHAIVAISLTEPFRFRLKSVGGALLDLLILSAVLVATRAAEHSVLEFLFVIANPDVTSVGIWSDHPWWVAMVAGPLLGAAIAAIRGRQRSMPHKTLQPAGDT